MISNYNLCNSWCRYRYSVVIRR